MIVDNVSHIGNKEIGKNQSEILCEISDCESVLKRSNPGYKALSNVMNKITSSKESSNEKPNMINLSDYNKFYCSPKNKIMLFNCMKDIILYEDEKMSNKLSYCVSKNGSNVKSTPVHIVEIPEENSTPIVCFAVEDGCTLVASGDKWKVNLNSLSRTRLDAIVKKTVHGFLKNINETVARIAIYYQHHGSTLFVKVQILDILTGGVNRELFASGLANVVKKHGYEVFVPRYHEFPYTNIHADSNVWYLSSIKKYVIDTEEDSTDYSKLEWIELISNEDDEIEYHEIFSCNLSKRRTYKIIECSESTKTEDERDLMQEVAIAINVNREFSFDNVILNHIPAEHWEVKEKYIKLIRQYSKNKSFRPIIEYCSYIHSPLHDEYFMKAIQMDPIHNRGFYSGLVKSTNGFRNPNFSKNAFNVEFSNVIKNYIILKMSESSHGKSDLTALVWGEIAKKIYEGKYYRVYDEDCIKPGNYWYNMGEIQDDCNDKQVLKWIRGERANRNSKSGFSELYSIFPKFLSSLMKEAKTYVESQYGQCELSVNIDTQIMKIENKVISGIISESLFDNVYHKTFMDFVDSNDDVLGVPGGIIYMDLYSDDPQIKYFNMYSEYIVTKSTRAKYKELTWESEYVKLWMKILKEIIKEDCVREKLLMRFSTKLCNKAKVMKFLFCIAGGSNGKSIVSDSIHHILGDYSKKLSSNLITSEPPGGRADPDAAQTDGPRGGYTAETESGQTLKSKRIKFLTEETRIGRDLHKSNKEITGRITIEGYSNFPLGIDIMDGGIDRRLSIYNFKNYFIKNPDPESDNEFKINRDYEELVKNEDAASALLWILLQYRIKFRKNFNDNWDSIPCEVMDRETEEYKKREDKYNTFVSSKIVRMEGFSMTESKKYSEQDIEIIKNNYLEHEKFNGVFKEYMTLAEISAKYKSWFKERFSRETSVSTTDIENTLLNTTKLKKYVINDYKCMGTVIMGVRYVYNPSEKLREEIYIIR